MLFFIHEDLKSVSKSLNDSSKHKSIDAVPFEKNKNTKIK
jgi:hypothetical protein